MEQNLKNIKTTINKTSSFFQETNKKMLIDGKWVESVTGEKMDSTDPATGMFLASVPKGNEVDIDNAVKAARKSFDSHIWCEMMPSERGKILWKIADLIEENIDELAELETLDQGKPLYVGRWAEMPGAIDQFRYFAGMTDKIEGQTITPSINYQPEGKKIFAYTQKEPVGVVGAITPWNSPFLLETMKVAPCLAAGCSMVLKPAEDTSLTAIRLGEIVMEAGLPEGVLNIVTGLGPEAGKALAEHKDVDKIAFTGSTQTGKNILEYAKTNLKKVALELGGKSPSIILSDAEMDIAIPGAANAIFYNGGQVCVAGSRLYIEKKSFDNVVSDIANIADNMKLGHGLNPETQIGPMVSGKQANRVKNYIDYGVQEGAEIVTGGNQLGQTKTFISPTVIAKTKENMKIVKDEIFGPVLVASPINSIEEIPSLANNTRYGLAASVWTQDISKANRLSSAIKTGTVWINCHLMFDASLPIGGYKESGWSRDSGQSAVENYLETKTVISVV